MRIISAINHVAEFQFDSYYYQVCKSKDGVNRTELEISAMVFILKKKRQKDLQRKIIYLIFISICVMFYYIDLSNTGGISNILFKILRSPEYNALSKRELNEIKLRFLADWSEVMRLRLDFTQVSGKCNLTWTKQEGYPWHKKLERTDTEKSYISLMEIRPSREFSRIILRTQFINGSLKTKGGDYWRVFVRGKSAIPVIKTDFGNGSYQFKFLPLYSGTYHIEISLEYTLCDGVKEPPPDWFRRGEMVSY